MRDILLDVVKHTHGLGIFDAVKVTGEDSTTKIEGMDSDRSVVLYGTLNDHVADLDGTAGLSNLGYLNWLLNWEYMNNTNTDIRVIRQERDGVDTPVEFEFDNGKGEPWFYRFMSSDVVEGQLRTVKMRDVTWGVTFVPSMTDIKVFQTAANGIAQFEPNFTVSMDGADIIVSFGSGANAHRGKIALARNVSGTLKTSWSWPIAKVLSILKLSATGTTVMSISDMGALRISHDSGMGVYDYILPAKSA